MALLRTRFFVFIFLLRIKMLFDKAVDLRILDITISSGF